MNNNVKIELTTSLDDWKIIRECYVHSFRRYPLYKYMVPEDSKRDAFLRAYLDANYEVTVGNGQGILLVMSINEEEINTNDHISQLKHKNTDMKVIGGVVILPPSSDGCGWAIRSDEPYWKAYEKYELAKISKKGLERVKRYEAWENTYISQRVSRARIPMWNGIFCAMLPEYTSKGLGSLVYKEGIKTLAQYWVKQQNRNVKRRQTSNHLQVTSRTQQDSTTIHSQTDNGFLNKLKDFSLRQMHCYALLSHRGIPRDLLPATIQQTTSSPSRNYRSTGDLPNSASKITTDGQTVTANDMMFNPSAPLVIAISHSDRAANFHQSNGFHPITRIPYYDEVEDVTPFCSHVLVLDPFRTGNVDKINSLLTKPDLPCRDTIRIATKTVPSRLGGH